MGSLSCSLSPSLSEKYNLKFNEHSQVRWPSTAFKPFALISQSLQSHRYVQQKCQESRWQENAIMMDEPELDDFSLLIKCSGSSEAEARFYNPQHKRGNTNRWPEIQGVVG